MDKVKSFVSTLSLASYEIKLRTINKMSSIQRLDVDGQKFHWFDMKSSFHLAKCCSIFTTSTENGMKRKVKTHTHSTIHPI